MSFYVFAKIWLQIQNQDIYYCLGLLDTFVNLFKKMELAMGLEPMTGAMNEVAFQQVNEE